MSEETVWITNKRGQPVRIALGDTVYVYAMGYFYQGTVAIIGPKLVHVRYTSGAGHTRTKAHAPDARVTGAGFYRRQPCIQREQDFERATGTTR